MANLAGTNTNISAKDSTEGYQVEENVRDEEFSKEETQNQLRTVENDFIAGMLEAAEYKTKETRKIEIIRDGNLFFSFHIHAVGEEEAERCKKRHTKYVRNKSIGLKFAEETDSPRFRSSLIYNATDEKDRAELWDNKKVWNGLSSQGYPIVNALDVIEAVLLGGEKAQIIEEINKLSGFETENLEEVEQKLEDAAKN